MLAHAFAYAYLISLHDWDGLSPMRWNGLDNYAKLFGDRQFWDSLKITPIYTLIYARLRYPAGAFFFS